MKIDFEIKPRRSMRVIKRVLCQTRESSGRLSAREKMDPCSRPRRNAFPDDLFSFVLGSCQKQY